MTHLSSKQISGWMLGERNPEVEHHLEGCGECHQEVTRLQRGLLAFKHSVHDWAGHQDSNQAVLVPAVLTRQSRWKWAAASAVITSAVMLPLYFDGKRAEREAVIARDSLLLTQVNARLAQGVPQSLEQLMELMNEGKEDSQ